MPTNTRWSQWSLAVLSFSLSLVAIALSSMMLAALIGSFGSSRTAMIDESIEIPKWHLMLVEDSLIDAYTRRDIEYDIAASGDASAYWSANECRERYSCGAAVTDADGLITTSATCQFPEDVYLCLYNFANVTIHASGTVSLLCSLSSLDVCGIISLAVILAGGVLGAIFSAAAFVAAWRRSRVADDTKTLLP